MARLKFGAFLAPHHPIGEHPTLQFRRDLDLAEHLDRLGYDEFWCGEHHSTGWEIIASPEMFLAAAGERTHRIMLGTGVVSLPYHHPFNVAQRIVQLDHMTGGRAIFGSGPGALPSDAYMLGIDPMVQRDRQDEAIGVIRRLLRGEERFSHDCDWFTLRDARLQLLPLQEDLPFAVASTVSPSGMTLAGKHGTGVLSIGSMSTAGLQALPHAMELRRRSGERSAARSSNRRDWRMLLAWHIAETREQARIEARDGLLRWHNEYTVGTLMRPGAVAFKTPDDAVDQMAFTDEGSARWSARRTTSCKSIRQLHEGDRRLRHRDRLRARLGEPPGARCRAGTSIARYVIPEVNGYARRLSRIAATRRRAPRRVRARWPSGVVEDHGERTRRPRARRRQQRASLRCRRTTRRRC